MLKAKCLRFDARAPKLLSEDLVGGNNRQVRFGEVFIGRRPFDLSLPFLGRREKVFDPGVKETQWLLHRNVPSRTFRRDQLRASVSPGRSLSILSGVQP